MSKKKILLVTLLLICAITMLQPALALKTDKIVVTYTPSKEFTDYLNAPQITQGHQNLVQKTIENASPFKNYASTPQGEFTCVWAYPYSGVIHASKVIGTSSGQYGLLWYDFDASTGTVQNQGFTNWNKYW